MLLLWRLTHLPSLSVLAFWFTNHLSLPKVMKMKTGSKDYTIRINEMDKKPSQKLGHTF
jgi:hypothetical protein